MKDVLDLKSVAGQFKRLYSGTTADDAEELNFLDSAPATSNLVEPTPVRRNYYY